MGGLEAQVSHFSFSGSSATGIIQASDFQRFIAGFAPATHTQ
jgi:hypothetical protein